MMAWKRKGKKHLRGFRLITYNIKAIIGFEILYKLLFALISVPFIVMLINASIRLTGFRYLTNQNLFAYLRKPQTIVMLILILLFAMLYIFFEMTALTGCFHASYQKKKITATDMFRMVVAGFRHVFRPNNISALLWLMMILPFFTMIYVIALGFLTHIPNFVKTELKRIVPILIAAGVLVVVLAMLAMRYLYCIQELVVENRGLRKGRKHIRDMMRGKYWRTGAGLLGWNLLCAGSVVLIYQVILLMIVGITKGLRMSTILPVVTLKGATNLRNVMLMIYFLSFGIINTMFIMDSYLRRKESMEEEIDDYEYPKQVGRHPRRLHAIMWYIIILLVMNSISTMSLNSKKLELQAQLFQKPVIMAHRGASVKCPENTLSAFRQAIDDKADWIELDVQMTGDGVVICTHDPNLRRVTGENRKVSSMTYEEIQKLDAGAFFSEEYTGEKIPTLEEVMELAAGKIKLNIEMKPTGDEVGFEEEVIRIIYQYAMEYDCMICSMNYDTLRRVKELAPNITTTYVLSMMYSTVWDLEAVDAYSIHYMMITPNLVYQIKSAGKDIYAWTVNDEKSMELMLERGVDGLITDDSLLATKVVLARYAPGTIVDMVEEAIDVTGPVAEASGKDVQEDGEE